MKKVELEGYLYLVKNEYDQYEVIEPCFDEDISNIFYKDLDLYSRKAFQWNEWNDNSPTVYKQKAKKRIESSTFLADILEKELGLKPGEEKLSDGKYDENTTFTFMPEHRKVRITIEEIEDE